MRREREGRRTATSSARTAPSVIQQRQTCPSGNCWKCSPHTRARTDRQPCSPLGARAPLRVDQPPEPRLRGPLEQQLAMGERTGGRHRAAVTAMALHAVVCGDVEQAAGYDLNEAAQAFADRDLVVKLTHRDLARPVVQRCPPRRERRPPETFRTTPVARCHRPGDHSRPASKPLTAPRAAPIPTGPVRCGGPARP